MAPVRIRLNAVGESYPLLRVVLGGVPALVGAYGLYSTLRRWQVLDSLKTDDLISTSAVMVVGGAVALWGLWRLKHPARWIELDRAARVLTLGLGGPLVTVPFDRVGALEVKQGLVPVKRGYVRRWEVRATGIPQTSLFVTGFPEKAEARKAELEALLRFPAA
ncbi:MAG: hypothetical protein AB1730_16545 [Myxococcota bacterium]